MQERAGPIGTPCPRCAPSCRAATALIAGQRGRVNGSAVRVLPQTIIPYLGPKLRGKIGNPLVFKAPDAGPNSTLLRHLDREFTYVRLWRFAAHRESA